MPFTDHYAAAQVQQMREARGLSPEDLAADIRRHARRAGWGNRGTVDAHTIRRIEHEGHVPGVRVSFVIASYFGTVPHLLWDARHRRPADQIGRIA